MTFPYAATVTWDAVPGAASYAVTLNGAVVGTPTTPTLGVAIPAAGTHTIGVTAVSPFERSPEGTLTFEIVAVGKPGNIKIR